MDTGPTTHSSTNQRSSSVPYAPHVGPVPTAQSPAPPHSISSILHRVHRWLCTRLMSVSLTAEANSILSIFAVHYQRVPYEKRYPRRRSCSLSLCESELSVRTTTIEWVGAGGGFARKAKYVGWDFPVYALDWVCGNQLFASIVPSHWGTLRVLESGGVVPLFTIAAGARPPKVRCGPAN